MYKATWCGAPCVVKQLQDVDPDSISEFLQEIDNMKFVHLSLAALTFHSGNFDDIPVINFKVHLIDNCTDVCTFFGLCQDPLSIVTEYIPDGTLEKLCRNIQLDQQLLVNFAFGILQLLVVPDCFQILQAE